MTPSRARILIVDDLPINIELLRTILNGHYELFAATNGGECLARAQDQHPDLILLDVLMPDLSGYNVCRQLKQNPSTSTIPVIFVSAADSPEERLEGFEAGGDEYVIKPVDAELLLEKVRLTLEVRASHARLQQDAREAMNAALEAMTASSELGVLIQFMYSSNACRDFTELAAATINSAQQYGLASSMMILDGNSPLFFGCSPQSVEARALAKCQQTDRICDFGTRTVFSDERAAILAKNMPLDDPTRYGRLKDNVAVLVNMTNSRAKTLRMEQELRDKRSNIIKSLIQVTEGKLQILSKKIVVHERKAEKIMQHLIDRLEEKLLFLGLEEDQELALRRLASDASDDIQRLTAVSDDLDAALDEILEGLYRLLEN